MRLAENIITLCDESTGSLAQIFVGFGCNCFQFQVATEDGPLQLIWSDPNFASGNERPSGSGIPILFPFPGRIAGESFEWEGESFDLESGDGRGNAIHGFVYDRPWRLVSQSARHVTAEFQGSVNDPERCRRWPADYRITVTYGIEKYSLKCHIVIDNPDSKPLPFGLGTHPYFRTPLGGPSANKCVVKLPVRQRWILDNMIPTGQLERVAEAAHYREGVELERLALDDVFTDLMGEKGQHEASIWDPVSQRRLRLEFDAAFTNCVVYNPPHREAVCIEPYSCAPNAIGLARQAIDGGLRILPAGEEFATWMSITLE